MSKTSDFNPDGEALAAGTAERRMVVKAIGVSVAAPGTLSITGVPVFADAQKTPGATEGADNFCKNNQATVHGSSTS